MARAPRTTSAAPPPAGVLTTDVILKGLADKSLTLDTDAQVDYDLGFDTGKDDANADHTMGADDTSFDATDSNYFKAGYANGVASVRDADAKNAANLGAAGDHDKDGKVGGAAPAVGFQNASADEDISSLTGGTQPTVKDEAGQAADDADYNAGYEAGVQYDGEPNDTAAGLNGKSDAYARGFRAGAQSDKSGLNPDRGDEQDADAVDIKRNSLDYDEGYRKGVIAAQSGVSQRNDDVQYSAEFISGYNHGRSDQKEGRELDKNVRSEGEVASERAQADVDKMSPDDRLRRVEQTLGLVSPSKE